MKRIILAAIFLLLYASSGSLSAQWARIYGGSVIWSCVSSIKQTSDGGYVVAGGFSGAGNYGKIWILKLSLDGEIEWQKTYTTPGLHEHAEASSIRQASDGGYVVAGSINSFGAGEEDFWILKLSTDGDNEWQRTYGGGRYDFANFVQQTSDGGYVVAGSTDSFGAGETDIWFLKLTSAGDVEWQKTYGGAREDSASFIRQTSDEGYMVLGYNRYQDVDRWTTDYWILKLSSEGDVEWQKILVSPTPDEQAEAGAIKQIGDGGYLVTGTTTYYEGVNSIGTSDIWVLKLSSEGEIEWQKAYTGAESDRASLIEETSDGGYIIAGSTRGYLEWSSDEGKIWILKMSSTGSIEWHRAYEGSGTYSVSLIKQTSDRGYIVSGLSEPSSDNCNSSDLLIMKLSAAGDIEWDKTYGSDSSPDSASFIQQTNDDGYIVVGRTVSWSERGLWILKLFPNGEINPRCVFIKSSNTKASDIDIVPEDTNITPEDTDITSTDTNITPQDTDVTAQNGDANVYDLISEKCTLTLSADSGGTTDPAPGTHTYVTGTKVTLKAKPSGDYVFNYWLGNLSCKKSPVEITMDGNKGIRAMFYEPGPPQWSGDGGGDGCFIATAAYCSKSHPFIKILRDFRDKYLMPSKHGRKIVNFYYRYSPFVANIITKHKILKVAVRVSLLSLIAISYSILHLGPIITTALFIFIFMLPVLIIWHRQRKQKRHIRGKKQND